MAQFYEGLGERDTQSTFSVLEAFCPEPEGLSTEANDTTWLQLEILGRLGRNGADAERVYATGDDWFSWRMVNWGTKWSDDSYGIIKRARSCSFEMQTPWGPALAGLATLSAVLGVSVSVTYNEPGMGLRGSARFVHGECVRATWWDDNRVRHSEPRTNGEDESQ